MGAPIGLHRHDGRMPYSVWTALTWDESPVWRAACKASKYLSSPPGVMMSSPRAVPPTLLNVCGLSRGRNTNEPGPASNSSPSHSTSSRPENR